MNERKSTEPVSGCEWYFEKSSQNPYCCMSSATQLAVQEESAVQQRSMSTTTSQMFASTQSYIGSTTAADTQLHQLPLIRLSSVGNNISGQARINITFNIQPPQWSNVLGRTYRNVFRVAFYCQFPGRVFPRLSSVSPNVFVLVSLTLYNSFY